MCNLPLHFKDNCSNKFSKDLVPYTTKFYRSVAVAPFPIPSSFVERENYNYYN